MAKNLVIVESPAKAKTIKGYLGTDYEVKSSFGHIRDLPKKGLSVDKDNHFEPNYEVTADKKKIVNELKKAAKESTTVWLASDEDREGEAIAWHLSEALKLDPNKTKRIVFHEITKSAILEAIKTPRSVDRHLVDAQQARRVLDRLVGYELSPVLWKKVQVGLSAGRVQSVAVRLIVEREREIRDFASTASFKIAANFEHSNVTFGAKLPDNLHDETTARAFLGDCVTANFSVRDIATKPGTRSPAAPFTTSTLQQEASRRLGFSVKQTMQLAQRLYEAGHITYMRTDSVNLSELALNQIGQFVERSYGKEYLHRRTYTTKSKSAQEAHEAIRPTDVATSSAGADEYAQKLYRLIWQRAVASQMAQASLSKTEIDIAISTRSELLRSEGEVVVFDGFMKVAGAPEDTVLPKLAVGDSLRLGSMSATETYSRAAGRYTEATLVRKLEELGIGRPSTYAPTISTIQDRGYVEKKDVLGEARDVLTLTLTDGKVNEGRSSVFVGADRNKLCPTPVAEMTNDFLVKYFGPIVDYDFTAQAEQEFDRIADGKTAWNKMIEEFYAKEFAPLIEKSADVKRSETSQMRLLGNDPKDNQPIFARLGRFGPMLQKGEGGEDKDQKPEFSPLPEGASLDSVTLEQALPMFRLPRVVGKTEDGQEITANIGRFGPYVKYGSTFVSIKPENPFDIDETTARSLIAAKREADANKYIAEFASGIKVVNGRYGAYITDGKKNAKIPKGSDPKSLSEAECKKLLAEAPAKGKFRRFSNKKKS